jgi:hypothetical protein
MVVKNETNFCFEVKSGADGNFVFNFKNYFSIYFHLKTTNKHP